LKRESVFALFFLTWFGWLSGDDSLDKAITQQHNAWFLTVLRGFSPGWMG